MVQADQEDIQQEVLDTASAILSISGPCRQIGDIYLACVATKGLGQCRPLRAGFEGCAKENATNSMAMLGSIGSQMFPDASNEKEQTLMTAQMINQQLFQPS